MRIILLFIACSLSATALAQNQQGKVHQLKYFDAGVLTFERNFPLIRDYNNAGVPNYNSIGLEGEFLTMTFAQWKWKQKIAGNLGGRKSEDLIGDIEFVGGYKGGFTVYSNRLSLALGSGIAYQPNPKLEIGIPVMFIARYTSEIGTYYLYDGQSVKEADLVSNSEASSANRVVINRKWMPGLKTGIEFIALPNNHFSFLFRMNYHYFGARDVYDVSTAKLTNGTVNVASQRIDNTSEWGFSLGMRYCFYTVSKGENRHREQKEKNDPVILDPEKRQ